MGSTDGHEFVSNIVDGNDVEITEASHQVHLVVFNQLLCGGTIVDERHFVTAAHCFDRYFFLLALYMYIYIFNRNAAHSVFGLSPEEQRRFKNELRVHAGSAIIYEGDYVYSVNEFYLHPKYVVTTNDYDVGKTQR